MAFNARKSLALWRRREAHRKSRHDAAAKAGDTARRRHWKKLLLEARAVVARRERQLAPSVRTAFNPRVSGYGSLGTLADVTVHHDAGAISRTATFDFIRARLRSYDAQHQRSYGGGIGYHEAIDPAGRLWKLRSVKAKGAHTGGHNSNNYGVMLLGNFDVQEPTPQQLVVLRARFTQPPPAGLPDLRGVRVRGHQDWPGPTNATACPGRQLIPHVHKLPRYAG